MGEAVGLKGISAMVVGGMGNIWGAIAGGLIIGLVEVFSIDFFGADFVDISVYGLLLADPVRAADRPVRRRRRGRRAYERLSRRHPGPARDQRRLRLWRVPADRGRAAQSRASPASPPSAPMSSAYLSNACGGLRADRDSARRALAAGAGRARRGGAGAAHARHLSRACDLCARPDRAGASILNLEVVGGAAGYPVAAFIRFPDRRGLCGRS